MKNKEVSNPNSSHLCYDWHTDKPHDALHRYFLSPAELRYKPMRSFTLCHNDWRRLKSHLTHVKMSCACRESHFRTIGLPPRVSLFLPPALVHVMDFPHWASLPPTREGGWWVRFPLRGAHICTSWRRHRYTFMKHLQTGWMLAHALKPHDTDKELSLEKKNMTGVIWLQHSTATQPLQITHQTHTHTLVFLSFSSTNDWLTLC